MQDAFDTVAHSYDAEFTHTVIGRAQRDVVRSYLKRLLSHRPVRILELNCGTGEDAVWLAGLGHEVTATDKSEQMLEIARRKSLNAGVAIAICQWDMTMPYPQPGNRFDLIFSNFGGMNCLSPENLHTLSRQLFNLLAPGGHCIMVVMGNFCLLESLHLFFTGKWSSIFRRKNQSAMPVRMQSGEYVLTWYYHPGQLNHFFSNGYRLMNILPVGVTIPPGYWKGNSRLSRSIIKLLIAVNPLFRRPLFARISDHFLLHIQKMAAH